MIFERKRGLAQIRGIRVRAKRRGLPCEIDVNWLRVNTPNYCPVLGIELEQGRGDNPEWTDNSPSVDRIDPTKGYVPSNCIVVSSLANTIRHQATTDQIFQVGDFYARKLSDFLTKG